MINPRRELERGFFRRSGSTCAASPRSAAIRKKVKPARRRRVRQRQGSSLQVSSFAVFLHLFFRRSGFLPNRNFSICYRLHRKFKSSRTSCPVALLMKTPRIILLSVLLCACIPGSFARGRFARNASRTSRGRSPIVDQPNQCQSLMKRGQGDAVVMFSCGVDTLGNAGGGIFYRGSPHSAMLGREVVERIDHAQFDPAVSIIIMSLSGSEARGFLHQRGKAAPAHLFESAGPMPGGYS